MRAIDESTSAALERSGLAPGSAALLVHGVSVHLRAAGAGPGVVLLHSSASSGAQWKALTERLAPQYRVLAPDLFGYGGSGAWPSEREDLIADEVAIVEAAMARAAEPVHLVGHSYGGHVAARAALAHPERVRTLTLIEPAMHYLLRQADEEAGYRELRAVADVVLAKIRAGRPEAAAAAFLDYWVAPGAFAALPAARRASVVESMRKLEYEWPFSLVRDAASVAELRALRMPTLVLAGEHTTGAMRRLTGILRRALPSCEYAQIGGAGHMAPVTHAAAVNLAIELHLARNA